MLAPRQRPPERITPAVASNTCRNETGPLAVPPVLATWSPAGRTWEKE